jgi:hypothetical protein
MSPQYCVVVVVRVPVVRLYNLGKHTHNVNKYTKQ